MARRVNVKVVGILAGAVGVAVAGALGAKHYLIRQSPEQFVSRAQADEKKKDWQSAVSDWQQAIALDPRQPEYYTHLGNALHVLAPSNPDIVTKRQDRGAWEKALELDPHYTPAAKSLYMYWHEAADTTSDARVLEAARDAAQKLHDMAPNDPEDAQVSEYLCRITIDAWFRGLDTDQARLDAAIAQVRQLMAQDPANADLPFDLARVDLRRGLDLTQKSSTGEPQAALDLFKRATDEMENALKTQGQNPVMQYRAAQIYAVLAESDTDSPDRVRQYRAQATQRFDRAIALLKGDEPRYVEIAYAAAEYAFSAEKDPLKVDGILQEVLRQHSSQPDVIAGLKDLFARMPDLRPQVIDILRSAIATGDKSRTDPVRFRNMDALTYLEIVEFGGTKDPDRRARLRQPILDNIKDMSIANLSQLEVAKLQGRFDLLDDNAIGAVQALSDASAVNPDVGSNPDILWLLAQAYGQANEPDQAETYLREVITVAPNNPEARISLAKLLVGDTTDDGQRELDKQMSWLVRNHGDDNRVIDLQIDRLDPQADADQITVLYNRHTESELPDILDKATMALTKLRKLPEAERLFLMARGQDPQNVGVYTALARVYVMEKRTSDAVNIIREALAIAPKNAELLYLQQQLTATSSADPQKGVDQFLHDLDPLEREKWAVQIAQQQGNLADEEKHLVAAMQLAPGDKHLINSLFDLYLRTNRFDDAAALLPKLGAINADEAGGLLRSFELARARGSAGQQMDLAQQLVAKFPQFAMAYYAMGCAYQAQKNYQLAIQNFETALQKGGDVSNAFVGKVQCLYLMNQPTAAAITIENGLKRYPADWPLQTMEAEYQLKFGDVRVARDIFKAQLRQTPGDAQLWLTLAQADLRLAAEELKNGDKAGHDADITGAGEVLAEGIKNFPDDYRFYGDLSALLLSNRNVTEAEKILLQLRNRPAWQNRPDPLLMLAGFYKQTNQLDKAEGAMKEAFDVSHHDPRVQSAFATLLTLEKKYDQAIALLESANTGDAGLRRQEIDVFLAAGKTDRALTFITDLLQHNPPDAAELHRAWSSILLSQGKTDEAKAQLDQALTLDPQDVNALLLRADMHIRQSPPDLDAALADLTSARTLSPGNVDVLSKMADIYFSRSDAVQGSMVLEQVVHVAPANLSMRLRLAKVYTTMAPVRLQAALDTLKEGESQPGGLQSPELANEESYIYQQLNRPDDAMRENTRALQLDPGNPLLLHCRLDLLISSRRYNDVVHYSDDLARLHPDLWWIAACRGQAKAGLNDRNGALQEFTLALQDAEAVKDIVDAQIVVRQAHDYLGAPVALQVLGDRTGPIWDIMRVNLLHETGDDGKAVQLLDSILPNLGQVSPAEQEALLSLAGQVYSQVQPNPLNDKAYAVYKQALTLKPNDLQVLNNLACICADGYTPPKAQEGLGYIQAAMDQLDKAGASEPAVQDTYGWLLILSSQETKGIEQLNAVVAHKPFAEAYYHLATGYYRTHDLDQARRTLDRGYDFINDPKNHVKLDPALRLKMDNLSNQILEDLRTTSGGGQ